MNHQNIAILFPGQGSQSIGMMAGWGDNSVVADVMARANEALNEDLTGLIATGDSATLNLTTHTQPAMLAASYAAYQAWIHAGGIKPTVMAGHSLGEYTAWVAAGCFDLADAIRTVRIRANAMQSAVPVGVGTMAAILGLPSNTVKQVCETITVNNPDCLVEAVNYNDPLQTVIAGTVAGVHAGIEACKLAGAKRGLLLPVSAPFHSSLMRSVAHPLGDALNNITLNMPTVSVINNVDVLSLTDTHLIKDALVRQSYSAVRWVETIQAISNQGITTFIECGPGKALAGMVKRIVPEATVYNVFDTNSLNNTLNALNALNALNEINNKQ